MEERTWVAIVTLVCASASAPGAARADGRMLEKGTMQVGGQISFTIERDASIATTAGYTAHVAPGFGYFIIDRLALRAGLGCDIPFGDLHQNAPMSFFFDFGARYFIDAGHDLYPYLGFAIGPSFVLLDTGETSTTLAFSVPVGLMYALNKYVALDFGTRVEYATVVSNGSGSTLTIPIGYLGIQAFFN